MKTRHIALLAALLLAVPASADEKKDEKKPVAKAKVELKAGTVTKVEVKAPEVKITEKKVEPKKTEPRAEPAKTAAPKTEPVAATVKTTTPSSQPVVPTVLPVDPDDIGGILKQLVASAKAGKWALLVGFIVMLLTWLVNKVLKQKIPSEVLPWLAIGLSTVATVSFSLATGTGWINAVVLGIQQGLMAAGGWSAIGKYIPGLAKKTDAPAAELEEPKP